MTEKEAKSILLNKLNFSQDDLYKLEIFTNELKSYNLKFNLISKSTVPNIWSRHILDSAQLVRFIDFKVSDSLADLGTGAGFPGIVLAIFNKNSRFHVKLYDKSHVKTKFLQNLCRNLNIKADIYENSYQMHDIRSKYVVSRAFKKLDEHIRISREIIKVNHTLIILKGKNAEEEIKGLNKNYNYRYRLEQSLTNDESKIVIVNFEK
jgi:16S rRNA (guanine527-N7)-methyltransferase